MIAWPLINSLSSSVITNYSTLRTSHVVRYLFYSNLKLVELELGSQPFRDFNIIIYI